MKRAILSWMLATSALVSSPAFAQTASGSTATAREDSGVTVADVVVTAQRREERLQAVPIAVSALSSEQMEARGVGDVTDLTAVIPSFHVNQYAGVNAAAVFTIRGVGPGTGISAIGANAPTSIYLDGVYLPRPDGGIFNLADVQRVEVLRGPQGTLYGRNVTAGAINIITQEPSETFRGKAEVSYGNYNAIKASGSMSGPLGGGLSAGLAASVETHDAYMFNVVTGNRLGDTENYVVHGKLRYENGNFDATLAGLVGSSENHNHYKSLSAPNGAYVGVKNLGDAYALSVPAAVEDRLFVKAKPHSVSLTANYKVNDSLQITSISGYQKLDFEAGLTLFGFVYTTPLDNESFYQEVRALYETERLKVTAGVNYFHEKAQFILSFSTVLPPISPEDNTRPLARARNEATAGYAQIEYKLADRLTAIIGGRLNYEDRFLSSDYRKARSNAGAPAPGNFLRGKVTDTAFLPMGGLNFQATRDVLLYGKVSRGYLAPGFNYSPPATATSNPPFAAEKLTSYEIGAKTQFWDRRATLNLAAYHYDYKDLQVRTNISPTTITVTNAGAAEIDGVDFEFSIRPVTGLTIGATAGWVDARYTNFCESISATAVQGPNPLCAARAGFPAQAQRKGNKLPYAPKWTKSAFVDFVQPISDDLTLKASLTYQDESTTYFTASNEGVLSSAGGGEQVDARVSVETRSSLEVFAFVKNLTDKAFVNTTQSLNSGAVFGTPNFPPRIYGVGVRYEF